MPATTRLLVTGATGFVGRAVVAAFARDHAVRAAARQAPQRSFPGSVEVVRHPDLSQRFDWAPILDGIDHVVHLAGIAHTGSGDPAPYDRVNREATAELAAAAAQAGVRRLVFVSSLRAQSGPAADHVLTESDEAKPTDAYGRSKLAAEAAVKTAGAPFTILRPVLLYGPGVKGNFALLLRAARSSWPLPVKDFTNRRSLLGVDNFISALRFVLATPATAGETYIAADPGIPPRLPDVIATLRRAQGRRPSLVPMPTHYIESALRLIGRDALWHRIGGNLRADPGKLIAAGWQPAHDTNSGLAALIQNDADNDLRPRSTMPPATPTPKM
ncbi:MAG: NAD-dependent epimerase/dehydratase family protein [Hyphomicrobiales bacterium]|nr:NAD-dependent epimerase/dehydratase family protein [Hyphomicrobiales bacterium]